MKQYALSLDLKNDPELIKQYEDLHKDVWPEILQSIKKSGIEDMEIYRLGTRLFMIMETTDEFSFEKKQELDLKNPRVQEWENLMWNFQQPLPGSAENEKWKIMNKIFQLKE